MKTNTFIKNIIFCSFVLMLQNTVAQLLYSNGSFITGTVLKNGTIAPAGYFWSELQDQNGIANASLGFTSNANSFFADDFTVPAGQNWNLTDIEVYSFSNQTVPYPSHELNIEIYNTDPTTPGASPIFGNMNTNIINSNLSTNTYRTANTWASPLGGDTYYKIFKVKGTANISLQPGNYWLVYKSYTPYVHTESPTVTVLNSRGGLPGWNAKYKYNGGPWRQLTDSGISNTPLPPVQQEVPFKLFGTITSFATNDDACSAYPVTGLNYTYVENNGALATNSAGFTPTCPMNDGEWFTFTGNGNIFTITVDNIQSNYDPKIGLFRGNDCGQLFCNKQVDDFGQGAFEVMEVNSVEGAQYWINIGHFSGDTDYPEGNFRINIKQSLINDICTNAKPFVYLPYTYTENFGNLATNNDGFVANCSTGMNNGEWFKFTGTGNTIIINLTDVQSNYDPEMAVYTGDCNNLTCYATADVGLNGGNENITIPTSILGQVYYVNIGHYSPSVNNSEGNFKLNITGFLSNDDCTNATPVTATPFNYQSINAGLAFQDFFLPYCGNVSGSNDGEWYQIVGNGGNMTIEVFPTTTYDAKISVFEGQCNNLLCEGLADQNGAGGNETYIIYNSNIGSNYFINVGQASQIDDLGEDIFTININSTIPLANNKFDLTYLKIYPNPVSDILKIEYAEKISKITISNLLGQELLSKKANDFKSEIDVSNLTNGAYFVKINADNQEQIMKIIKK